MHSANINVVVLWEHELKQAAAMLKRCEAKDATEQDFENAMKACWVAINPKHLLDETAHLVVMVAPAK